MQNQYPDGSRRFLFGDKPHLVGTYNWVLRALSDLVRITDAKGQIVRLSHPHRFRQTRGTRDTSGAVVAVGSPVALQPPPGPGVNPRDAVCRHCHARRTDAERLAARHASRSECADAGASWALGYCFQQFYWAV
jgi:hypothetical protein